MTATKEAVLMTEPPPPSSRWGMPCLQHRNTLRRLTSCTRSQAASVVSSTEPSSAGEMPALLTSTSMRPNSASASAYIALTCCSSVTSTFSDMSPGAPSERSTPTTRAPSRWNTATVAAPIPPEAPVTTHTLLSSLMRSPRCVVDGLDLGVGVERVRPELTAVAGLLEAAERRAHAHRGVGVDRDRTALDRARHAQGARAVARPDRAGQAIDRVVGQARGIGLTGEGDHDRDRTEDLLARGPRSLADRGEHR